MTSVARLESREEAGRHSACLAQRYPPLTALFTLLEESTLVGGSATRPEEVGGLNSSCAVNFQTSAF